MVGLLGIAGPLQEQHQRLVPGRLRRSRDAIDPRADVGPDLGPHLAGRPAQRPGVLQAQGVAAVGGVAEERQLRPPRHPHREPGRAAGCQRRCAGFAAIRRRAQAEWTPSRQQPDRGLSPGLRERPPTSLSSQVSGGMAAHWLLNAVGTIPDTQYLIGLTWPPTGWRCLPAICLRRQPPGTRRPGHRRPSLRRPVDSPGTAAAVWSRPR